MKINFKLTKIYSFEQIVNKAGLQVQRIFPTFAHS